ncbi:hypothetical protein B0H10DRAFT_2036985 [Mycena sp. CBHHK59/15]|nr:hypothetical protein B0H10DRAFT_2036985 [Mycena sp. CBHHK59/15]
MEITTGNVWNVINASFAQMKTLLPRVFAKLEEPDQTDDFLYNYTGAIKKRFEMDQRPEGQVKLDFFGEIALKSGIAKTMMRMALVDRPGTDADLAAYYGFETIWCMIRTANVTERRALVQDLIKENAVQIALDAVAGHRLCIVRHGAANFLRSLASESFLGDYITSKQASDIFMTLSRYVLAGPNLFIEQMGDSETTWQSIMCFGNYLTSASKAAAYAPRYYAMSQESAIWTLHGILCRSPPPSQQFALDIIKHDPEILDLLFECATVAREPWYPETQVDSIASEVLMLLFRVYLDAVLGISVQTDKVLQAKKETEWDALVESLKILTSRPNWAQNLIAVWKRIEGEKWQRIKPMMKQASTQHFAQTPLTRETFLAIFEYRGSSRVCMLRIIATLTHVADECNISDADLVSFLPVCFSAVQPTKTMQQSMNSEAEMYAWIERNQELFRSPMDTVFTSTKVEPPEQVPDESVMGPIAFSRVLAVLASRGVLDTIPKWKKLPDGISTTVSLSQVKDIASQATVRRAILLAVKRVTERREQGHKRIKQDNEMDYAGFAYSSAAELAAALVAFDTATDGKHAECIRGVRKELILCLGNAAEMALGLNQKGRALEFALAAGSAGQNLPETDAVDDSILAKNRRRVERARAQGV